MNTITRLTHFTMLAATVAAGFLVQPAQAADASPKAVWLDTVVVTGKRLQAEPLRVVQLPTVVVTGKRFVAEPLQVVQLPTVVITGKRLAPNDTRLAQKALRDAAGARAI